ncbi:hypothetical protein EYF80_049519 [Liparis tanakae]|uniref:Uncharacterized protein n=1 Tax=Liparis tanakae TaxID=230148 RepID=A0A4Z2FHU3_9TELE|nr:hypothetical protein EYF80_049519 [Liparis tanakae]
MKAIREHGGDTHASLKAVGRVPDLGTQPLPLRKHWYSETELPLLSKANASGLKGADLLHAGHTFHFLFYMAPSWGCGGNAAPGVQGGYASAPPPRSEELIFTSLAPRYLLNLQPLLTLNTDQEDHLVAQTSPTPPPTPSTQFT